MAEIVSGPEYNDGMMDYIVRECFENVTKDPIMEERFIDYFKRRIIGSSMNTSSLYLSDDEKRLEYAGRNTIEPVAEYLLNISESDSRNKKRDFAERGAVFSIVHPVISLEDNQRYFSTSASMLYGMAADLSEKEPERLYRMLSGVTREMMEGLESILKGISEDGKISHDKAFREAVATYQTTSDEEEKEKLARSIAGHAIKLGLEPDSIPLERRHYRHLFETPEQRGFSDGPDKEYEAAMKELMEKSRGAASERQEKARDMFPELFERFEEDDHE